MSIPIKQTVTRTHRLRRKVWTEISAAAWQVAGEAWHAKRLPRKWGERAAAEYGFEKRSRKYQIRKRKKFGHVRPLEFTGELRRKVLRLRDVRSTGDRGKRGGAAKVVLHGPSYLFAYRKDLGQVDKAKELRAVSQRDAEYLARVLDRDITARLKKTGRKERLKR